MDDRGDIFGDIRSERPQIGRLDRPLFVEDSLDTIVVEGRPTRKHMESDDAPAIDVSAVVDGARAAGLLGAHVTWRPDDLAAGRQVHAVSPQRFSDSEIQNESVPRGFDHDVRGLDVSVDDAVMMRMIERICNGRHDVQDVRRLEAAPLGEQSQEGSPFQILHDEIAVADVVDGDDVGVRKSPHGACLSLEALEVVFGGALVQVLGPNGLDGDDSATQWIVPGLGLSAEMLSEVAPGSEPVPVIV